MQAQEVVTGGRVFVYDIIQALGSGNAVVIYGAGPSCQNGLPSWPALTERCVEKTETLLGRELPAGRAASGAGRFAEAFGMLSRTLDDAGQDGRAVIDGWVREAIADPGQMGRLYGLLARLPVRLYLTTNYDEIFERHLRDAGFAPSVHTYTRESLEEIDTTAVDKSVVHVHGLVSSPMPLVLTDGDYAAVRQAKRFEALRIFLQSHFAISPILMVGFSMMDPNVKGIARQVALNIRRRQQPIVLLADASRDEALAFARDFNVRVVPSRSANDFAELEASLTLALKWLDAPQTGRSVDSDDMRLSQALYVMRAVESVGGTIALQATKALVVAALRNGETLEVRELERRLR
ncbi:MAG: SIR2 family protein, partial [Coriobacteriia bacterium]|nr:SIR2 family protein [Coriobacteriia bacterium]